MAFDRKKFLSEQKKFWEVADPVELKFNRVDTLYGEDRTDDTFEGRLDSRMRWLTDNLTLPSNARIVEIGCGIGAVLSRLRLQFPDAELYGIDISSAMISAATELLDGQSVNLCVTEGDVVPNVAEASVDYVVCTGVFIHIMSSDVIKSYFREVGRVLKKGGFFRFNIRIWNPELAFGDSIGGRVAKMMYNIGLRSNSRKNSDSASFAGVQLTLSELAYLCAKNNFVPDRILFNRDRAELTDIVSVDCEKC